MPTLVPASAAEDQVAALREEIRRAGAMTGRLRSEIVVLAVLFTVEAGLWAVVSEPNHGNVSSKLLVSNQVAGVVASIGMAGIIAAMPIAAGARRLRRWQIRHRLAALPPDQQAAVLVPLSLRRE